MQWFNEERQKTLLTFPVETMALLTDGNDVIDKEYKNFTAEIEEVKEVDDKFHVLLNKTAFFPGGGGQYCDLGIIDNINVLDVYEENDKTYMLTFEA